MSPPQQPLTPTVLDPYHLVPAATTGDIVRYNLSFDWKELAPDGFTRPTITVNGQFPAPTIRCKQGDRLIIR
jgi:FtsP/CotA-like multicopper oxidase with cupredoxin domain